MLEETSPVAQRASDPLGLALVERRPGGVVVDERDRAVGAPRLADRHLLQLLLALRRHSGQVARNGFSSNCQSLYATRGVSSLRASDAL